MVGIFFVSALAFILSVILLLVGYVAVRAAILLGRKASFSAWIVDPAGQRWIRGVALYGAVNLAWYRLANFRTRADLLLPRTRLEVLGGPVRSQDGAYTIVRLRSPEGLYTFAVAPGDAAGLISWVNSAPPGINQV